MHIWYIDTYIFWKMNSRFYYGYVIISYIEDCSTKKPLYSINYRKMYDFYWSLFLKIFLLASISNYLLMISSLSVPHRLVIWYGDITLEWWSTYIQGWSGWFLMRMVSGGIAFIHHRFNDVKHKKRQYFVNTSLISLQKNMCIPIKQITILKSKNQRASWHYFLHVLLY